MGRGFRPSRHGRRRGSSRAAAVLPAVLAALLLAFGCGKSGHGAETDPEKGSDVEILNAALGQEQTVLEAYVRGRHLLRGPTRTIGRQLRAHEQEYGDALTKAIRGLGGTVEAQPERVDFSEIEDEADFLALAYKLESAALASYVDAAPRFFTSAPRTLDVSLAAGHAQHLVVLRQALDAGGAASVPEAFDGGEVPPPPSSDPDGAG